HTKSGEALLHFSLGDTRSLLWSAEGGKVSLTVLPPRLEIEAAASIFRTGLENKTADAASGRQLYEALFSHLPPAIHKTRHWRIVADGALSQIPFAAIENTAGRYLVQDPTLRMVPHAFSSADDDRELWAGPAAAFGDPVYNPADTRVAERDWVLSPSAPW